MSDTRKRLTKEERIKTILEASIEVMAKDGFKKASTREIAKLAKCTEGLIFRYFKTKEDILNTIIKNVFEENNTEFLSFLNQDYSFKILLEKLLSWAIGHFSTKLNLHKVIIRQEYMDADFGHKVHQERSEKRTKFVIQEFERRKKIGELKKDVDCKILGNMIMESIMFANSKVIFLNYKQEEVLEYYKNMFNFIAQQFTA